MMVGVARNCAFVQIVISCSYLAHSSQLFAQYYTRTCGVLYMYRQRKEKPIKVHVDFMLVIVTHWVALK